MSKIKSALDDFTPHPRLIDERGATQERIAKAGDGAQRGDTGIVSIRETPIDRAVRRGTLNECQGRAAEKYYLHWFRGGMEPSYGNHDISRVMAFAGSFSGMARTEAQAFHRQCLRLAISNVKSKMEDAGQNGADAIKVLEAVVCHEMPFKEAGFQIGYCGAKWAEISAITLSRMSLNILIREWGLT